MKYAPIKEQISFDDFAKVDIRVGLIVEVREGEQCNTEV
ncbi:hypothetical protein VIBR0546_13960 [Vibrio brasiliensis LMG 20546]|jgi:tRNA-binding protein|uniref:tRNA-binding protein n=1 Tax=Vibrio brasiliensis LMG 20546 TaxID=945543 RepID=E8LV11_9VIBR|nr:hypothetical protein VIBR0546_13960 [Vibrio brasiliensis LMG 20546]